MTIQQFNPPHPGGLIKRTYIEPFPDVTAAGIARELGVAFSKVLLVVYSPGSLTFLQRWR